MTTATVKNILQHGSTRTHTRTQNSPYLKFKIKTTFGSRQRNYNTSNKKQLPPQNEQIHRQQQSLFPFTNDATWPSTKNADATISLRNIPQSRHNIRIHVPPPLTRLRHAQKQNKKNSGPDLALNACACVTNHTLLASTNSPHPTLPQRKQKPLSDDPAASRTIGTHVQTVLRARTNDTK